MLLSFYEKKEFEVESEEKVTWQQRFDYFFCVNI